MSRPVSIDVFSDSDGDDYRCQPPQNEIVDLTTPPSLPQCKKKQRTEAIANPSDSGVFIIDDDPTPSKQTPTGSTFSSTSIVVETPFSQLVKCSTREYLSAGLPTEKNVDLDPSIHELLESEVSDPVCSTGIPFCSQQPLICDPPGSSFQFEKELYTKNMSKEQIIEDCSHTRFMENDESLKSNLCDGVKPKRTQKAERLRLMEEKKQRKEFEKLRKAASKAEAADMIKRKKEMQKWEKGKFALKSIMAEIDRKVVELGSIGGQLLSRFSEKGLSYRITSNPLERSIVWTMTVPEEIATLSYEHVDISYVLIIYEAEEFCNHVLDGSFLDRVTDVRRLYPHHTICYLTNRLTAYINKREQAQYKNHANNICWRRPAIEEVFAQLSTNFFRVHSRQCFDEAELSEHVVGLTCSLASCQFRKKLTRLSVNANGSVIPKDCVDKKLMKKSLWLKALIAIPKVQPRFALAIWKKYSTMKSLMSVYMDPTKSVHEKEFLLKDLITEGLCGDDRRLGEVCSKRIYRILMAGNGSIKTDDVENGADFFSYPHT